MSPFRSSLPVALVAVSLLLLSLLSLSSLSLPLPDKAVPRPGLSARAGTASPARMAANAALFSVAAVNSRSCGEALFAFRAISW